MQDWPSHSIPEGHLLSANKMQMQILQEVQDTYAKTNVAQVVVVMVSHVLAQC